MPYNMMPQMNTQMYYPVSVPQSSTQWPTALMGNQMINHMDMGQLNNGQSSPLTQQNNTPLGSNYAPLGSNNNPYYSDYPQNR